MFIFVLFILLIFNSLTTCQSCSSGLSISIGNENCFFDGTKYTCLLTMDTTISINAPGLSYCIDVLLNNTKIGKIVLTYLNAIDTITLNHQYHTSEWESIENSAFSCGGDSVCGFTNNCGSCNDGEVVDRTAGGRFPQMNLPGQTYCLRSCSSLACGCCSVQPSCVFLQWGIKSIGRTCHVYEPLNRLRRNSFKIEIYDENNLIINTEVFSNSAILNNYTISYLGSLTGDLTSFGLQSVLFCSDGSNYLTSASPVNQPKAGSVGDIQANTINDLIIGNSIIDLNILLSKQANVRTASTNKMNIGMSVLSDQQRIPIKIGQDIWYPSSVSSLESQIVNPGVALFILTSTSNLKFTKIINIACQNISLIKTEGCYSCQSGSKIMLNVFSTCSDGIIDVFIDDKDIQLVTTKIQISKIISEKIIFFDTNKKLNNFNLIFNNNFGLITKINIQFVAYEDNLVKNQTFSNTTKTNIENNDFGFNPFLNALLTFDKWTTPLDILFKIIWLFLFLIVSLLFIFVLYKLSPYLKNKKENQASSSDKIKMIIKKEQIT